MPDDPAANDTVDEIRLEKYGVRLTLSPDVHVDDWHRAIDGDLKVMPVIQAGMGDYPVLLYLAWQAVPNIASAIQTAEYLRTWWVGKVKEGKTPTARIDYTDGKEKFKLELQARFQHHQVASPGGQTS